MSYSTIDDAIKSAKNFSCDSMIFERIDIGDYVVIANHGMIIKSPLYKHVATVKAVTSHEVTIHD